MLRNLQYPLPGLSHCDCFLKRNGAMPTEPCSTLYRAYPIATSAGCAPRCSSASLQYPLPGLSHCDDYRSWRYDHCKRLAVPSTGPIPLRHVVRCQRISKRPSCSTLYRAYPIATIACQLPPHRMHLQYPLPGLSHCDMAAGAALALVIAACSTLYRAYPIATRYARRAHRRQRSLQYPLPGLSHCDLHLAQTLIPCSIPLAVPSTGPIPLRHISHVYRMHASRSCSTLYRAYPIATVPASSRDKSRGISCSTLYRAYPIAT